MSAQRIAKRPMTAEQLDRFDDASGTPVGDPFPVTGFRSAQFLLTPRTVQMDIGITATRLLLPMTESRSDIWMLDQVDR